MAIKDGKIVKDPNEPDLAAIVGRRYIDVNGGRGPWVIEITRAETFEVGPFGHHGATIQFGSFDPAHPFSGTFSANLARSIAPAGRVSRKSAGSPYRMAIPCDPADYDPGEVVATVRGQIYHLDGIATRVRIDVTVLALGAGGHLACFVI